MNAQAKYEHSVERLLNGDATPDQIVSGILNFVDRDNFLARPRNERVQFFQKFLRLLDGVKF